MRMRRFFLLLLTVGMGVNLHGQNSANMAELLERCEELLALQSKINALNDSIKAVKSNLERANQEWEQICENYMLSGGQTAEDFAYLISHTDSISEKNLRERLIDASINLKRDGDPYVAPVTPTPTIPSKEEVVPPIDPREEGRGDNNDNRGAVRGNDDNPVLNDPYENDGRDDRKRRDGSRGKGSIDEMGGKSKL